MNPLLCPDCGGVDDHFYPDPDERGRCRECCTMCKATREEEAVQEELDLVDTRKVNYTMVKRTIPPADRLTYNTKGRADANDAAAVLEAWDQLPPGTAFEGPYHAFTQGYIAALVEERRRRK